MRKALSIVISVAMYLNLCCPSCAAVEASTTNETQNQNLLELTNNEKELLSVIRKLSSERDQVKLIGVADNYAKTLSSYITNAQNNKEEGSDAQQRTGKVG